MSYCSSCCCTTESSPTGLYVHSTSTGRLFAPGDAISPFLIFLCLRLRASHLLNFGMMVTKYGYATRDTSAILSKAHQRLLTITSNTQFAAEGDSGAGLLFESHLIGIIVKIRTHDETKNITAKAVPYWLIVPELEWKYFP